MTVIFPGVHYMGSMKRFLLRSRSLAILRSVSPSILHQCSCTVPTPPGYQVKWHMHNKHATSMTEINRMADASRLRWVKAYEDRRQNAKVATGDQLHRDWSFYITVYHHLPTYNELINVLNMANYRTATPITQAQKIPWMARAVEITTRLQDEIGETKLKVDARRKKPITVDDHYNLMQLFDAEPCEGCGWKFEA